MRGRLYQLTYKEKEKKFNNIFLLSNQRKFRLNFSENFFNSRSEPWRQILILTRVSEVVKVSSGRVSVRTTV